MTADYVFLSTASVAAILAGVAVLAMLAALTLGTFGRSGRGSTVAFFVCLAAIWAGEICAIVLIKLTI